MNWFENISITLSYNPIILIVGFGLIISYTFFIYKTTLPLVGKFQKGFLILIRTLVLSLLLLLLFDPILKITTTNKIEPENLVFIDNSKSISEFTSAEELEEVNKLILQLENDLVGKTNIFSFGSSLERIEDFQSSNINFNNSATQFNLIIDRIKKTKNLSSVVIISDGINNEGKNPQNSFNEFAIPIYAVGIGDTSTFVDLAIEQLNSNEFLYTERQTEVEAIIRNENLSDQNANVQFFDNDKLISTKSITLSKSGINRIKFPYQSSSEGEHKLTVKVLLDTDEKNISNNTKSKLINILASKKKIALLAGGPSPDLAMIVKSIKKNEDFELIKIIEIGKDLFYDNRKDLNILRESDLIFLVGFPSIESDISFIKEVESIILEENKSVFITLANTIDYTKLSYLQKVLPFRINNISDKYYELQVTTKNFGSSLLGNSDNIKDLWNKLPPIFLNQTEIIPSVSSEILVTDNLGNNLPIIFTGNNSNQKSLVITASNIWRWQLKNINNEYKVFDNFILNAIKWLSIYGDDQYFSINIAKKSFNLGESIIFNAYLFNETLEPLNNEKIILKVGNNEINKEFNFSQIADGIYETEIKLDTPGKYSYSAELKNNSRNLKSITGSINIEPIELELLEGRLNSNLLESISKNSGGIYTNIEETDYLIPQLNKNYEENIIYKKIDNELRLSILELILLVLVLLFSIEWITRKVLRMI